jgi:hypothetical protein
MMPNNPLHAEPRAARFGEIIVVRRGPVNGAVSIRESNGGRTRDLCGLRR